MVKRPKYPRVNGLDLTMLEFRNKDLSRNQMQTMGTWSIFILKKGPYLNFEQTTWANTVI